MIQHLVFLGLQIAEITYTKNLEKKNIYSIKSLSKQTLFFKGMNLCGTKYLVYKIQLGKTFKCIESYS